VFTVKLLESRLYIFISIYIYLSLTTSLPCDFVVRYTCVYRVYTLSGLYSYDDGKIRIRILVMLLFWTKTFEFTSLSVESTSMDYRYLYGLWARRLSQSLGNSKWMKPASLVLQVFSRQSTKPTRSQRNVIQSVTSLVLLRIMYRQSRNLRSFIVSLSVSQPLYTDKHNLYRFRYSLHNLIILTLFRFAFAYLHTHTYILCIKFWYW